MTRRTGLFAALLLLMLLCGCAKESQIPEEPAEPVIAEPASQDVPPAEPASQEQPETKTPESAASEPETQGHMTWDERVQALLDADTEPATLPEQTLPLDEAGACAIAQAEAQRPRYQYQGWASVFSSPLAHLYTLERGERFHLSHLIEPRR